MDQFERTFLPISAQAGVEIAKVSRHIAMLRRCITATESTAFVARCTRLDRPLRGEHLMVGTHRRLVVTHDSPVLHRLRLHLNSPLTDLSQVSWAPDRRLTAIELAATASDGVRERFLIKVTHPRQIWHLESTFVELFRGTALQPVA